MHKALLVFGLIVVPPAGATDYDLSFLKKLPKPWAPHPLSLTTGGKRDLIEFSDSLTDEKALQDPRWGNPW